MLITDFTDEIHLIVIIALKYYLSSFLYLLYKKPIYFAKSLYECFLDFCPVGKEWETYKDWHNIYNIIKKQFPKKLLLQM